VTNKSQIRDFASGHLAGPATAGRADSRAADGILQLQDLY